MFLCRCLCTLDDSGVPTAAVAAPTASSAAAATQIQGGGGGGLAAKHVLLFYYHVSATAFKKRSIPLSSLCNDDDKQGVVLVCRCGHEV